MSRSPLFDFYDPEGLLDQQVLWDDDPFNPQRRKPTIADLMPEEEKQGLLRGLANATTSGLGALGWALDTPGAVVRGTVSGFMDGDPLKGVRALWENSDERVDGRELLRQMGVVGKEDTWGNWLGGLVGEIALDPLTYINPASIIGRGAATTAGRGLARAGLLDDVALKARNAGMGPREYLLGKTAKQVTDEFGGADDFARAMQAKGLDPEKFLDQPAAALTEFRVPGFESGVPLSLGKNVDAGIARFFDNTGKTLATNPLTAKVAGGLTARFDPSVMGRTNYDEQWRAREAFSEAAKGERDFRGRMAEELLKAREVAEAQGFQFSDQRIQNAIADSIENIDPERLAQLPAEYRQAIDVLESVPEWRGYRDALRNEIFSRQSRLEQLGVKTPMLDSQLGFFPRQQVQFARPRVDVPTTQRARRPYDRGDKLFSIDDVVGKSRRDYLRDISRAQIRQLMTGDQGKELYSRLFQATEEQIPDIIDDATRKMNLTLPYDSMRTGDGQTMESLRQFLADPALTASERAGPQAALQELERQSRRMKVQLGELLRSTDRNFADKGIGLFDRPITDDVLRYGSGTVRSQANARVVAEALLNASSDIPASQMPGGGYTNLLEAASGLGFDKDALSKILAARLKDQDIASLSVPNSLLEELSAYAPATLAPQRGALGKTWDSYTNLFKVLALAKPSYHTRNIYSGLLSSLTAGGMNPISLGKSAYAGLQAGKGNYGPMIARLKSSPAFKGMTDKEIETLFLVGGARNDLGLGLASDLSGDLANTRQNLLIGQDVQRKVPYVGDGGLLYDPNRTWQEWLTVRGVDRPGADGPAPTQTFNPLIDLHERTGRRSEDFLRLGTFIEGLRQGMSPDAAARQVFKTQVDYSPRAFTEFERKLKRYIPFYSYNRGITPLVVENLLYRPGGLQGQITRAVSSAARPGEDSFTPEDLRKSTAIQLPGEFGDEGQLRRYLTNIDLPWRGLVDLFFPYFGNNALESIGGTIQRTGLNLLGQTNPLIKAPLEYLTDRQFYSGRDLSDTYSMFEQNLGSAGRPLEQVIMNAPGGSTALGLFRTAVDERLSPLERALKIFVNNATGLRVTDRDIEKSKGQAARQVLTQLLKATPGVRSYENLSVPDEALADMTPEQLDMYLLYRTLQSDASKRARERKKAEEAMGLLAVS